MKIIDRYIAKAIAQNTLLVMLVIMTLFFFATFVYEVVDIGKDRYTFGSAVRYSLVLLPRQLYEVFPMIALLGVMLGLGGLSSHSELTVMRAAGLSMNRVTWAVLKVGLLYMLLMTIAGEVIGPEMERHGRALRAEELGKTLAFTRKDGLWLKDSEVFIHIGTLNDEQEVSLKHLQLFKVSEDHRRIVQVIEAEEGIYRPESSSWQLYKVEISHFNLDGTINVEELEESLWQGNLTPQTLGLNAMQPEYLDLWSLYQYISYLQDNHLDATQYKISLWGRLTAPLGVVAMIMLAVPFVFISGRMHAIGRQVMFGVLIGIGYYLGSGVVQNLTVLYGVLPFVGAMVPPLLLFCVYWLMLRKTH